MDRYTINCTPEQTKKALELGAPIDHSGVPFEDLESLGYSEYYKSIIYGIIPTAEEMIGWLRSKGFRFKIDELSDITPAYRVKFGYWYRNGQSSNPKEATLAAIDAALEYLINNKK